MVEMIFLMDFMDRKEERKRDRDEIRRNPPGGGQQSDVTRLLEEMRESRRQSEKESTDTRHYVETLLLGRKVEDAEAKAKEMETAYKASNDYITSQQKETQAMAYYTQKLEQLVGGVSRLPPQQQNDFLGEVMSEVGGEVKQEFKDRFIKAIRGEAPAGSVAPMGGIPKSYWDLAERALGVLEKYITAGAQTPPPPPRTVQPIPQAHELPPEYSAVPLPPSPDTGPSPESRPEAASYERVPEARAQSNVPPATIFGALNKEAEAPPSGETTPAPEQARMINPMEAIQVNAAQKPLAEITDIHGIGPKYSQELQMINVSDVRTLAGQNPDELASKLNIPPARAKDWVDQAKDLI